MRFFRRRLAHSRITRMVVGCLLLPRVIFTCPYWPRKRTTFVIGVAAVAVAFAVFKLYNPVFTESDEIDKRMVVIMAHLQLLDSLYINKMENVMRLQEKDDNYSPKKRLNYSEMDNQSAEVMAVLKNATGMRVGTGLYRRNLKAIQTSFSYQLLPHLVKNRDSLRPAYHLKGNRSFVDVVVGIPTVRRDKESYLTITIFHLIKALTPEEYNSTAIIVFIGETDLEFVLQTAKHIENLFPQEVANGMIEVMSPSPSFYPNFDELKPTLGDSQKRCKWRTKQNLDTMFLMAYAQTKGAYYLMIEDDVIARKQYMTDIKVFTTKTTLKNPEWFFIAFSTVGGIGKLFRSTDLLHFVTYVQLFYDRLPIDWLLESYLSDRICPINKNSKECGELKTTIRPKYKTSLFYHIGLYSSLKGKIHTIQQASFGQMPPFFPHPNPPLNKIVCNIEEQNGHTLKEAYNGHSFFWGTYPKKGDVLEFWFAKPTVLEKYIFRSGNVKHMTDKFYNAVVEVLPKRNNGSFIEVGSFDEFGLADGSIEPELNPIEVIRLRVMQNSTYWIILSEIELQTKEKR